MDFTLEQFMNVSEIWLKIIAERSKLIALDSIVITDFEDRRVIRAIPVNELSNRLTQWYICGL